MLASSEYFKLPSLVLIYCVFHLKKEWYIAPLPLPMLLSERNYLLLLWIPFPFT